MDKFTILSLPLHHQFIPTRYQLIATRRARRLPQAGKEGAR
jgi:hypothetical protein